MNRTFTQDEAVALARLVNLEPNTLAWMWSPTDEAPTTPVARYPYEPLTDAEWEIISPHWPAANQASTPPRNIVDALLKIASTGCGWGNVSEFATTEAARQQYRRRAKSRVLVALPRVLSGQLVDWRLRQFDQLAKWA